MKRLHFVSGILVIAMALFLGAQIRTARMAPKTPSEMAAVTPTPTPKPKATPAKPTTTPAKPTATPTKPTATPTKPPTTPAPKGAAGNMTNGFGMKFVTIPAGSFQMGFNTAVTVNCSGCAESSSEKPVHKVTISRGFEMQATEVTQEQWQAVMGKNPSLNSTCPKCPVEQVSWDDAQEFVSKLNSKSDGYKYRLPTEAEWEYAARAGSTTKYPFGDDDKETGNYAWFGGNYSGTTHEAATKKANTWGLFDMLGNVGEWVEDEWDQYPSGNVTDPVTARSGSLKSIRGGSYYQGSEFMRSSHRNANSSTMRHGSTGFRVVRTK